MISLLRSHEQENAPKSYNLLTLSWMCMPLYGASTLLLKHYWWVVCSYLKRKWKNIERVNNKNYYCYCLVLNCHCVLPLVIFLYNPSVFTTLCVHALDVLNCLKLFTLLCVMKKQLLWWVNGFTDVESLLANRWLMMYSVWLCSWWGNLSWTPLHSEIKFYYRCSEHKLPIYFLCAAAKSTL